MNEDGPNKWAQAVLGLENIRRGSGLPSMSPDSSYFNSVFDYREIRPSGYVLNTSWNPKKTMVYKAGLEALLYGDMRISKYSLHLVLLHDLPLPSVVASPNDWHDLLPFVLKPLGMRTLPNLRWSDRRIETGRVHLDCDAITYAAVPYGISVRGYALLGDIFSPTGIQPFMAAPAGPFYSNGGDLILEFGGDGIFSVDAIAACAAGLHQNAKR